MAVFERRTLHEAELARVRVECRWRVLCATTQRFPLLGSSAVEAAVDQAWMELYEGGGPTASESDVIQRRWERLAHLRALNIVRERRRHPSSSIDVEELSEAGTLSDRGDGGGVTALEAIRTDARAQEIVRQVGGDGRRWLEATLDDPGVPPRVLAQRLEWDPEKLKSVARRTRGQLREFVSARASGAVCERRQAVIEAFAATHLAQREQRPFASAAQMPTDAAGMAEGLWLLGEERYQQVALHIAGCESCERAWREAGHRLLRVRHALFLPFGVTGKLVGGGGALAAARHPLLMLQHLAVDLRTRLGFGIGRASAGGAAGGAGTVGVLASKSAVVCAGLVCAAGAGTAALVGLPPGLIAPRTAAHHRHRAVAGRDSRVGHRSDYSVATAALGSGESRAVAAREATSSTRAGLRRSASTARVSNKLAHPATPGDLIASTSRVGSNAVSKPTTALATAASTRTATEPTNAQAAATRATPVTTTRSSTSACVPGSLGCR